MKTRSKRREQEAPQDRLNFSKAFVHIIPRKIIHRRFVVTGLVTVPASLKKKKYAIFLFFFFLPSLPDDVWKMSG